MGARACALVAGGLLRESLLTCALTADALTADTMWSNRARRSTATIVIKLHVRHQLAAGAAELGRDRVSRMAQTRQRSAFWLSVT